MIEKSTDPQVNFFPGGAPVYRFDVTCDFCADGIDEIDAEDLDAAEEAIKEEGWEIIDANNKEYHQCPDCAEGS